MRQCEFCEIEGTKEYGELSRPLAKRRRRASRPRYSPAALRQSGHNYLPLVFTIVITHVLARLRYAL